METYLSGARGQVYTTSVVLPRAWSPAKVGRPKRGRSEGSALQYNHELGSLGKQISCSQLAAAICEGREQGCRKAIAFFRLRQRR